MTVSACLEAEDLIQQMELQLDSSDLLLNSMAEVQKAYELLKELAEKQGLGKEVRELGRESQLEAWLARGVFQRLYQDAIDRWGRAEDRARKQHRVELSNFVRKMESLFEYTTDDLVMEISPKLWSPQHDDVANLNVF